jgi:Domain of unknown function (DUF4340)
MRYWPTLVMVFVLAGLGLYLYVIELPQKESHERQDTADKKVLAFDQDTLSGLTIKTDRQELVFARTPEQGWALTAPFATEADQREVQNLIRALLTGTVTRIVEDHPTNLAPFGLDHPVTTISVVAGASRETFSIGESGPLSSTLYVLRESDRKVLLTTLAPKDFVNKTLMTFRRKDILHMAGSDVERIRLTYPATEIVLYQGGEKPKSKWKIRYPIEAEADQTEVRALLFRLEDLKALGIVDPGPERDALAKTLTAPKVKVVIHTADGDQTVRLYQPDEAGGVAIAETSLTGPLYRLTSTAIKDLTKELFTFQDKRLLGIDYTDIAMLSIKTPVEQYVLIHQQNEWVLEDQPAERLDQQTTDLFVSRVANVPAEERVIKQAGPLAPYGLVIPAAEFIATGRDGKSGGKLSIGSHADGLAYAMGQRISGIFQIRADLLTQIPTKSDLLAAKTEKVSADH